MPTVNEQLLEHHLTDLEKARQWSPRVISKLETTIRTAEDYDLYRINPIQYAEEKRITEKEAIDLFLHSSKHGLFEMEWDIVCPVCAQVAKSFNRLDDVHPYFICRFCSFEGIAALDDFIQITFTISTRVREIAYHHPENLSIEDFYWKYHLAKGILPLPNGLSFYDVIKFVTKLITFLEPQESARAEFDSPQGLIIASDYLTGARLGIYAEGEMTDQTHAFNLKLTNNTFRSINGELTTKVLDSGHDIKFNFDPFADIHSGKVIVEFENATDQRAALWVMHYPLTGNEQGSSIRFAPFLSGKRLLTTQTFRDLFRAETVQHEEGIKVHDLTYLFTDLKGSTALYDEIGDPKAYYLVRQHFETLIHVVADNNGALVKTIGDAIMGAFMDPLDAVKAAIGMILELEAFNESINETLIIKVGIHKGRSIAVTLNERLDYFGQSVNVASRVQNLADGNDVYITKDIFDSPGVQEFINEHQTIPEHVTLKGVSEKFQVYRIIPRK